MTVGKDFAKFDAHNHVRRENPISPVNVAYSEDSGLRDRLAEVLAKTGIVPAVRLVDAKDKKPVTGVVFRTAVQGQETLVTAVNLTERPVACVLLEREGNALTFHDVLDLRPGQPSRELRMAPLGVVFGTARRRATLGNFIFRRNRGWFGSWPGIGGGT